MEKLGFKLHHKSSFIFNGIMLTRHQYLEPVYNGNDDIKNTANFYNITCYGNWRFYNHMRKSFRRHLRLEIQAVLN